MNFRWKEDETANKNALLLVAFPELEATPFQTWIRSVLAFVLEPLRRGFENLMVDTLDAFRLIFGGKR